MINSLTICISDTNVFPVIQFDLVLNIILILFLFLEDESAIIKEFNVCDTYLKNITDANGFIHR
jgi:hypothetical protein